MVSAVEELSRLTTKELSEMLRESDNFILRSKKEDGGSKQVLMCSVFICCDAFALTCLLNCRWIWKNLCPHFLFISLLYVWSLSKALIWHMCFVACAFCIVCLSWRLAMPDWSRLLLLLFHTSFTCHTILIFIFSSELLLLYASVFFYISVLKFT
jgi:hypothetical protein